MNRFALATACLLLAVPASASLVEDLAGGNAAYQHDGGVHGDAPDTCAALAASPHPFEIAAGGTAEGILLPPDDAADHYRIQVSPAQVGARIRLTVSPGTGSSALATDVLVPGCADGSVFLAGNQPAPPHSPPPAGPGERHVQPHNLDSWACGGGLWRFVLNHVHGITPPATIQVTWSDGTQEAVPLASGSGGAAKYETSRSLGHTLHNVTAVVPQSWSSQFSVGAGPCGVQDGGAVFGAPPARVGNSILFTPVRDGLHVLAVRPGSGAPAVPTGIAASCHTSCLPGLVGGLDTLEYRVSYLTL